MKFKIGDKVRRIACFSHNYAEASPDVINTVTGILPKSLGSSANLELNGHKQWVWDPDYCRVSAQRCSSNENYLTDLKSGV